MIHTYTHIYIHIHICIHMHIHRYINIIHITNSKCMHSHIYKYTLDAHTHDYAHVHAIVKMQFEIVLTRAQPNKHMNNYMHHTDMHVRKHIYANTCVHSPSLSQCMMLSLVMSQLRICLQVTINPFPPGHRSTQKPGK